MKMTPWTNEAYHIYMFAILNRATEDKIMTIRILMRIDIRRTWWPVQSIWKRLPDISVVFLCRSFAKTDYRAFVFGTAHDCGSQSTCRTTTAILHVTDFRVHRAGVPCTLTIYGLRNIVIGLVDSVYC